MLFHVYRKALSLTQLAVVLACAAVILHNWDNAVCVVASMLSMMGVCALSIRAGILLYQVRDVPHPPRIDFPAK